MQSFFMHAAIILKLNTAQNENPDVNNRGTRGESEKVLNIYKKGST